MTNADYAYALALLANTPAQAESLDHSLKQAAGEKGANSALSGRLLELVDKFIYLDNNISSTESRCQHIPSEGVNCYRQVIDHMEI